MYVLISVSVASYPGHVVREKSGLVSTVCTCVNDYRNFPHKTVFTKLIRTVKTHAVVH